MAFQQLLVAATHFIAEQEATYHEHLDALREMEDAPEDALWDVYLEMQTCEPPPTYSTDLERVCVVHQQDQSPSEYGLGTAATMGIGTELVSLRALFSGKATGSGHRLFGVDDAGGLSERGLFFASLEAVQNILECSLTVRRRRRFEHEFRNRFLFFHPVPLGKSGQSGQSGGNETPL